jgi:NAD(P)-dependent dehydrogenase (short-subunit alcohol dehydrogenase family)
MKTVFITGAAAGIGLAIARRFAADGWLTGLYDIDEERIGQLLETPEFSNACGGRCDVTSRESVSEALAHFADRTQGRLDLLVNNAGVLKAGQFETIEPDTNDMMIKVNILGLTQVAQLAFPLLQQTPNATMVNMCSVSSVFGVPLLAVYSASKFYVNGLTQALSIEWAQYDIRVLSIKPPFVKTGMVDDMPEQLMEVLTVDLVPEDIAEVLISALKGTGESYLVGWKAKALGVLNNILPASIGRRLTMRLTGYPAKPRLQA